MLPFGHRWRETSAASGDFRASFRSLIAWRAPARAVTVIVLVCALVPVKAGTVSQRARDSPTIARGARLELHAAPQRAS
jgi:hypothetical protein